jgi:hypothetical protein
MLGSKVASFVSIKLSISFWLMPWASRNASVHPVGLRASNLSARRCSLLSLTTGLHSVFPLNLAVPQVQLRVQSCVGVVSAPGHGGSGGLSSRARRRDRIWPPLHRRDLQRRSLPGIDPGSRCSPTRPLQRVRPATAVCYLQRDVFIKRRALDWLPAVVHQRRPHCAFPPFTTPLPAPGS